MLERIDVAAWHSIGIHLIVADAVPYWKWVNVCLPHRLSGCYIV